MKKPESEKMPDAHNTSEQNEPQPVLNPQELPTPEVETPTPQVMTPKPPPQLKEDRPPSNLDTGEGYRSSSDPVIGTPENVDRATGEIGGLLDRIRGKVGEVLNIDTGDAAESKPRATVKVTKKQQSEFMDLARMVLSPLLILAATQALGEICAPTQEEADQFVEPLARIIARHVPIPDHMSADLIDMLGMLSISVVWYMRVNTNLPWNSGGKKPPTRPTPPKSDGGNSKAEDEKIRAIVAGSSIEEFIT